MAKTASLTSGLVSKKPRNSNTGSGNMQDSELEYFKALTVKLDKNRYMALKKYGLEHNLSSQKVFVKALDNYLR